MFCGFFYFGLLPIFVGITGSTITSSKTTNNVCLSPSCEAPNNMSLGLTIDQVSGEVDMGVNQIPTDHCSCCPESRRDFYTSATTSGPYDAIANAEVALSIICSSTQLCLCDSAEVCCTPASDSKAPSQLQLIPYCDDSGCMMNALMEGEDGVTELGCENGMTYTYTNQQSDDPGLNNPLNSGSYFNADRVSCRGCANIRVNGCVGPTLPGPA
ncbi:hypothetical protein M3Y94_00608600 [Aphelenchoides besseyi]|nr:hypothetical protein M3Y94_00608600 [Aphelenchoides besseyi]KAI6216923.1 hypothetical protein M3Y95_01247700 [Aphelenchoides besseyi]